MFIGRLRTGGAICLALALAACVPDAPGPRRSEAPMGAQADATLARLQGRWVIVEATGETPGDVVSVQPDTLIVGDIATPLSPAMAGRFRAGRELLWVHWLDADDRTAAIGLPESGRVWIMDRTGAPGERLEAARTILDWYGYDLSLLARAQPGDQPRETR